MVTPRWSNTWFRDRTQPIWEEHLRPLLPYAVRYVEIGVCEGASALWMLANARVESAKLIDPYRAPRRKQQPAYDRHRANALHNLAWYMQPAGPVQLIERPSIQALAGLVNDGRWRANVAYVDGDHSAPGCMADMVLAWELLDPGGLLVVDDLNRAWHGGKPLVFFAVRSFRLLFHGRYEVEWELGRQICFRKGKG